MFKFEKETKKAESAKPLTSNMHLPQQTHRWYGGWKDPNTPHAGMDRYYIDLNSIKIFKNDLKTFKDKQRIVDLYTGHKDDKYYNYVIDCQKGIITQKEDDNWSVQVNKIDNIDHQVFNGTSPQVNYIPKVYKKYYEIACQSEKQTFTKKMQNKISILKKHLKSNQKEISLNYDSVNNNQDNEYNVSNDTYQDNGNDSNIQDYLSRLQIKINNSWNKSNIYYNGKAVIRFKVDNNGNLYDIQVAQSSGNQELEQSALNAVHSISPTEKPPSEINNYIYIPFIISNQ